MTQDRLKSRWHQVRRSLITRMLLVALLVVSLGFAARLVVLRTVLTGDVTELSASHQLAIAGYAARDVEDKVRLRLDLLSGLAPTAAEWIEAHPGGLAEWLSGQRLVLSFFAKGLFVADPEGRVVATTAGASVEPGSDWLRQVGGQDRPSVGTPFPAADDRAPSLSFAVPLRAPDGTRLGVLGGVTAIQSAGFLHALVHEKVGQGGSFLLVAPAHHTFVVGPEGTPRPLPAPGINPLHDRAMAGYRGSGVTTNARGEQELSAIADVPTPGWFLVARMPMAEATQPLGHLRILVVIGGVIVPLLVLTVLAITLPRLFRPLTECATLLHKMASGEIAIRALPVVRDDEVGDVAKGFNFLLGVLRDKEHTLLETQARLRHMAHHDPLTGLPNRAMFEDRLDQALLRGERQGEGFAVLYIDLDGFKPVNDSAGHAAGDAMLRHVARRLEACLRKSDTVARIGGDEFAILLGDVADLDAALLVAAQCRATASQPMEFGDRQLAVGLSIGCACYPRDGKSAGELLRHADHAMYQAKQAGKAAQ